MSDGNELNYKRIETAIEYIKHNFKEQPSLNDIADVVGLSNYHFQRLFAHWAGVSPKKFIQYLSLEYAKKLLAQNAMSLEETAYATGFSGSSRLHDLFVNIEAMTPGDYKKGGMNLSINYSFSSTLFGNIIVASTSKGICYMAFGEEKLTAFEALHTCFPNANFVEQTDDFQYSALSIFSLNWNDIDHIKLHIKGTDFQLKVWEALLSLPLGGLASYGQIAKTINQPQAFRAVGSAIGSNPVAFVIPCHRVIQKNGDIGGYMWGNTRKSAIIAWEASKLDHKAN